MRDTVQHAATLDQVQAPHWSPSSGKLWATVAPLLERWQMALVPRSDGTWDVLACFPGAGPPVAERERVPFAQIPQAVIEVAARLEAQALRAGEGEP